jgi:hypothetical protein
VRLLTLNRRTMHVAGQITLFTLIAVLAVPIIADIDEAFIELTISKFGARLYKSVMRTRRRRASVAERRIVRCSIQSIQISLYLRLFFLPWFVALATANLLLDSQISPVSVLLDLFAITFIAELDQTFARLLLTDAQRSKADGLIAEMSYGDTMRRHAQSRTRVVEWVQSRVTAVSCCFLLTLLIFRVDAIFHFFDEIEKARQSDGKAGSQAARLFECGNIHLMSVAPSLSICVHLFFSTAGIIEEAVRVPGTHVKLVFAGLRIVHVACSDAAIFSFGTSILYAGTLVANPVRFGSGGFQFTCMALCVASGACDSNFTLGFFVAVFFGCLVVIFALHKLEHVLKRRWTESMRGRSGLYESGMGVEGSSKTSIGDSERELRKADSFSIPLSSIGCEVSPT